MSDRRYTEEEVALILERASQDTPAQSDPGKALEQARGLSLRDVQAIAAEVGIDVAAVERAALAINRGDLVPAAVRVENGAPIAVSKTIDFGRDIDDRTWARMVVQLQETFSARGKLRTEGAFREWSNGNLRAVLEPTEDGHRLRLSTVNGNARGVRVLGNIGLLATGAAAVVTLAVNSSVGAPAPHGAPWLGILFPGVMGLAAHLQNYVALRRWGRTRAAQMEALPATLRALVPGSSDP
jgi:hypothetical protein